MRAAREIKYMSLFAALPALACGARTGLDDVAAQGEPLIACEASSVPVEVSSAEELPTNLLVDGPYVYWTPISGDILRARARGGPAERFVDTGDSAVTMPGSLAIDDQHLFYVTSCGERPGCGVLRVDKANAAGGPTLLQNALLPTDIALTNDNVYWMDLSDSGKQQRLRRVPKQGGAPQTIFELETGNASIYQPRAPSPTSSDGSRVYVYYAEKPANAGYVEHLVQYDERTGSLIEAATLPSLAWPGFWLATRDGSLFWTEVFTLFSARVGGEPIALASGTHELSGLDVDEAHVYWFGADAIRRVPTADGAAEIMARHHDSGPGESGSVAIDDRCVFWTRTDGRILATRK